MSDLSPSFQAPFLTSEKFLRKLFIKFKSDELFNTTFFSGLFFRYENFCPPQHDPSIKDKITFVCWRLPRHLYPTKSKTTHTNFKVNESLQVGYNFLDDKFANNAPICGIIVLLCLCHIYVYIFCLTNPGIRSMLAKKRILSKGCP